MSKKKAFTLIELLVVIAIIAILASILFPVFARARENARRASCMSNLKQIGLGMMMYVQDYDETYPMLSSVPGDAELGLYPDGIMRSTNWIIRIYPYVKSVQVFDCPSDGVNWKGGSDIFSTISYGANYTFLPYALTDTTPLVKMAAVDKVSQTIMLGDNDGTTRYAFSRSTYSGAAPTRWLSDRHLDGANIAFADGHVKWFKMSRDPACPSTNTSGCPIPPGPNQGVYWKADGSA